VVEPLEGKNSSWWDGNTQGLLGIAQGSAGIVFALSDTTVVKVYLGGDTRSTRNSETERQAYRNLEPAPTTHILRCYDVENPYGLVFERCRETVRQKIRSVTYSPGWEALSLAIQAAKGLNCVHFYGIIQGDVGCHNMLLDNNGVLKIADFAGSSVNGCRYGPSVDYEVGSKLPGNYKPTLRTDIFALGSAIYEMITRKPPFKGLTHAEVQRRFERGEFPHDFVELPELGYVVEKCWGKGGDHYNSAAEVLEGLYKLDSVSPIPPYSGTLETAISCTIVVPSIRSPSQREPSPNTEPRQCKHRKRSREGSVYVTSRRKEKDNRKSRGSRRSHRRKESRYKNGTDKQLQTKDYNDGAINHLVERLQALWHGGSRSLSDKKRSHR